MIFETSRLYATHFTPDMAEAVYRNSQDEDNRRFVPDEVYETLEEAAEALNYLIQCDRTGQGPQVYPLLRVADGAHLGYIQLVPMREQVWEVGYHIAQPFTRQGYATEALTAFLPVLAERFHLSDVLGVCLAENLASRRVLEKCGFRKTFEGLGDYQGQRRTICIYHHPLSTERGD